MSIQNRKKDHVRLSLREDVQYRQTNGLNRFELSHNALPEVDYDHVSTETPFLGKTFSFPLFISSMTGGYDGASSINAQIARVCQERNLPFGVGSQRVLLEEKWQAVSERPLKQNPHQPAPNRSLRDNELLQTERSYSVVRDQAPDAFIAANIGGVQLINTDISKLLEVLIGSIRANAVVVHLNPLQELMQPEGDRSFKGVLHGIRDLCTLSPVPVIVKETGAGITAPVAKKLLLAGVDVVDVAGAGGTSWAKIENLRHTPPEGSDKNVQRDTANENALFADWGIDTASCLLDLQSLRSLHSFELISSGGIQTPFDLLKSICLGADMVASAGLILKTLNKDGESGLHKMLDRWERQTRIALTLIGCERVTDCSMAHLRPVQTST